MLDDERDIDYSRLAAGLDRERILTFAQQLAIAASVRPITSAPLTTARSPGGGSRAEHLLRVANLSVRYVDILYQGGDKLEARYFRKVCEAAGFLHESLTQSCSFEELVAISDEAVATLVSSITPDLRESAARRIVSYSNRVGMARREAQLVVLADLRHEYDLHVSAGKANLPSAKIWAEEAVEVIMNLRALRNTRLESRVQVLRSRLVNLEKGKITDPVPT